jgi:hypothetical protein
MDYNKIDLNASATKGFADISAYMEELGNLSNNMKAQQKFKLLNHKVILQGLSQLSGLNEILDGKVKTLLKNIDKGLDQKKTPFVKIFSFHILAFVILFTGTVFADPDIFSIGYGIVSIGMGCATGVLNLMLLRERKKFEINNVFFLLEDENIEELEPLHKKLSKLISDFKEEKSEDNEKLKSLLKETIQEVIK